MKKSLLFLSFFLFTLGLSSSELLIGGNMINVEKSSKYSAVKTEKQLKNAVATLKVGKLNYSILNKTDGLPIYFINEMPVIIDNFLYVKGEKNYKYLENKYDIKLVEIMSGYNLYRFSTKNDALIISEKIIKNGDGKAFPEMIKENFLTYTPVVPNDKHYSHQWFLHNTGFYADNGQYADKDLTTVEGADIKFDEAVNFLIAENANVDDTTKVAIMDSGVATGHPDLNMKLDTGYNAIDDVEGGNPDISNIDSYSFNEVLALSHGTNCAGVSAAEGDDNGVTGVCPWCGIYPVKYLEGVTGSATTSKMVLDSFQKYVDDPAIVAVNCSYGPSSEYGNVPASEAELEAHKNFLQNGRNGKGGAIVYAAGNDNVDGGYHRMLETVFNVDRDGDGTEETETGVVTVAAVTAWDTKAVYSNFGSSVDVAAPSLSEFPVIGMATTAIPGYGDFDTDYSLIFSGTSAAAPVITGFLGTLFSVNPDLTLEEAVNILKLSADKINPETGMYDENGHSVKFGYGRANLLKAVRLAMSKEMCASTGEEKCDDNIDNDCDGLVNEGCNGEIPVGNACETDEDCKVRNGYTGKCLTSLYGNNYPGGICVLESQETRPCPDGTVSTLSDGIYYCVKDCSAETPCNREEYYCSDEVYGVCTPYCRDDKDCNLESYCNSNKKCQKIPQGIGGKCDTDEDCDGNQSMCIPPSYYPNGYCTAQCRNEDDSTCPTDGHCIEMKTGYGTFNMCLGKCTSDEDCRPDSDAYICHVIMNGKEGVCYRKCKQDSDCGEYIKCTEEGRCDDGISNSDSDKDQIIDEDTAETENEAVSDTDTLTEDKKSGSDGCSCSLII